MGRQKRRNAKICFHKFLLTRVIDFWALSKATASISTHARTRIRSHMHAHTNTCTHMHTHVCNHLHTQSHMHTRICMHTCTYARTHAHTHSSLTCVASRYVKMTPGQTSKNKCPRVTPSLTYNHNTS